MTNFAFLFWHRCLESAGWRVWVPGAWTFRFLAFRIFAFFRSECGHSWVSGSFLSSLTRRWWLRSQERQAERCLEHAWWLKIALDRIYFIVSLQRLRVPSLSFVVEAYPGQRWSHVGEHLHPHTCVRVGLLRFLALLVDSTCARCICGQCSGNGSRAGSGRVSLWSKLDLPAENSWGSGDALFSFLEPEPVTVHQDSEKLAKATDYFWNTICRCCQYLQIKKLNNRQMATLIGTNWEHGPHISQGRS